MKTIFAIVTVAVLASGCSEQNNKQSDTIDNTPPSQSQSGNTAPTDKAPAPQGGTGGDSQSKSPSGTVNR